jgi:fatty acid desaturase
VIAETMPIRAGAVAGGPAVDEPAAEPLDVASRRLIQDLHDPRPAIFWSDLVASAAIGWAAFGLASAAPQWTPLWVVAVATSALALYRGLSFTHELTHLRRRAVPGFETAWNLLFGVPLLLPSFTYVGVHQSHHNLSTYGTDADPEYLPFARSRRLIIVFALQSSLLIPILLAARFLVLAPFGLLVPQFHRWLEAHASSFSMNPKYRRVMTPAAITQMKRWELVTLFWWGLAAAALLVGVLPWAVAVTWWIVLTLVSFLNTLRVLGAHEYESDGQPKDRFEQLRDSIDTPGGPWTELWAPVGLRYHALHHYYPGIPYHNLGRAYRRLIEQLPPDSGYQDSTSPSLGQSLRRLLQKASRKARSAWAN